MIIRFLGILLICIAFPAGALAQTEPVEVHKSTDKVIIERKVYYIHVVRPGQTLYSISRVYNVPQKEILLENPSAYIGLQAGQALKIPYVPEDEVKEVLPEDSPGDFVFHTVEPGQTLFFLSRTYNVGIDDILEMNPGVDPNDLQINQVVRIPAERVNVVREGFPSGDDDYIHHKVEKGETPYSISRQYEVPLSVLRRANPRIIWGIKYGEYIRIPKYADEFATEFEAADTDHEGIAREPVMPRLIEGEMVIDAECARFSYEDYNRPFNVALMLPLYIDKNYPVELPDPADRQEAPSNYRDNVRTKNELFNETVPFLEFYEGALMAVDSLVATGLDVVLNVYDTERNPSKVRDIISLTEFRNTDLIIGPVYPENIEIVAGWAQRNRVNIVSPLAPRSDFLAGNPYLFQVTPSASVELEQASVFISNFPSSNFVLIHKNDPFERNIVETFKNNIFKHFSYNSNYESLVFKEVVYTDFTTNIEQSLIAGEKNIVIIPSSEQAFVSDVLMRLNNLSRFYDITIFGLNEWQRFANIEVEYLHNMELHFASPFFIDYENEDVKQFLRRFREKYRTEPSYYGFQGYDIMFYFLQAMKNYGPDFRECLPIMHTDLLQTDFLFRKSDFRNGFENNGIFIVKYGRDLNIKRLGLNARSSF
jgi:LysM repeat protein